MLHVYSAICVRTYIVEITASHFYYYYSYRTRLAFLALIGLHHHPKKTAPTTVHRVLDACKSVCVCMCNLCSRISKSWSSFSYVICTRYSTCMYRQPQVWLCAWARSLVCFALNHVSRDARAVLWLCGCNCNSHTIRQCVRRYVVFVCVCVLFVCGTNALRSAQNMRHKYGFVRLIAFYFILITII